MTFALITDVPFAIGDMVVSPTQAAQAAPPPVLLLTAGDGPWQWRRTNYMLLDGALDQTTTTHSLSSIRQLRSLGSVMRRRGGLAVRPLGPRSED